MAGSEYSALRLRRLCGGARGSTVLIFCLWLPVLLDAQNPPPQTQSSFPDTETLLPRVVQHQKEVESQLEQYTFTETTTTYTLDKKGETRNQHTDVYYVTPTAYEFFVLHISHDGKQHPRAISANKKRKSNAKSRKTKNERRGLVQSIPKTPFC